MAEGHFALRAAASADALTALERPAASVTEARAQPSNLTTGRLACPRGSLCPRARLS